MRLRPIGEESIFDGGKQIVKQEKDGVKVVASYDGKFQQYMVFDVEVFNKTNQPLTISPKDFTFTPLDENQQPLVSADGKYTYEYTGIEPKEQLSNIRYEMAYQEAKIKRAKIVNTVLFVGGLVALVASTSGRGSEGAWRTARVAETVVQATQVKRMIDHTNYYSRMDNLSHQEQIWSQENFRTTTLTPNTSIRGDVFLEANPRAKFVRINFNNANAPISFLFEQWFEERRR